MSEQSFEQSRGGADDPAGTYADLDAALEQVIAAARRHLAAVKQADGRVDDDSVWRSYVELNNTTFAYDDLMLDACGEVTPWDVERIEPEEADSQWLGGPLDDASDEPAITISVRQRRDYEVPSVRALLRVAAAVRRSAASGADTSDADREITDVGDAIVEILQAGDGALGSLDIPELEPLDSVVAVSVVPEPLDPESLDDTPDAGFRAGSDDRLLCRYYERDIDGLDEEEGELAPPAPGKATERGR